MIKGGLKMGVSFVILGAVSFGLGSFFIPENPIVGSALLIVSVILIMGAIIVDLLTRAVRK
jgi:hypothetical protein